jgi:hypothetical protein
MFTQGFQVCKQIPKLHKNSQVTIVFFALLESASTKSARKALVKSTSGVNFINILPANFS